MPWGELQSVTSVKYVDRDEAENTFSSDSYSVDTDSLVAKIYLNPDESWPSDDLWPVNAVVIRAVVGFGDDNTDIVNNIKHAMKMLISDMYENRESILTGSIISENTIVAALLWPFRLDVF